MSGSMPTYLFGEHEPQIHPSAWVADTAQLLGRVVLEADASVWYGAVLRGDNDLIHVGARTNVQDGCVLHTDTGLELRLGAGVTVGHQAMLHGCQVGDHTLIGLQSIVLNGARIGRHCLVGAGALVGEGKVFPDGVLILGAPARVVRELEPHEVARLQSSAEQYVQQQRRHRALARRID